MAEYTAPDLASRRISLPSTTTPSTLSTPWCTRAALDDLGAPSRRRRLRRDRSRRRRPSPIRRSRPAGIARAPVAGARDARASPRPSWRVAAQPCPLLRRGRRRAKNRIVRVRPRPLRLPRDGLGRGPLRLRVGVVEPIEIIVAHGARLRVSTPGRPLCAPRGAAGCISEKSVHSWCPGRRRTQMTGEDFHVVAAAQLASRRLRANSPKAHDGGDHIHRERGEGSGRARGPGPRPRSRRARRDLRDREGGHPGCGDPPRDGRQEGRRGRGIRRGGDRGRAGVRRGARGRGGALPPLRVVPNRARADARNRPSPLIHSPSRSTRALTSVLRSVRTTRWPPTACSRTSGCSSPSRPSR